MATYTFSHLYISSGGTIQGTGDPAPYIIDEATDDENLVVGENFTLGSTTYTYAGTAAGGIVANNASGPGTILLTNTPQTLGTTFPTPNSDDFVLCFLTGTLIATPRGPVPVEELRPGDAVLTRHGPGIKRVRWVGEQAFDARFITPDRAPVRILAGALGHGLPRRDLVVSPAHAVVVDGVLVDARLLVNGEGVVQQRAHGTVAYRHIDLGEHDCVLAEGAWAESYRETGDRRAFHNAATAAERPVEPPCLPHVSAADDPRLPALRARLRSVLRRSA